MNYYLNKYRQIRLFSLVEERSEREAYISHDVVAKDRSFKRIIAANVNN
jgi:hypothetical protein